MIRGMYAAASAMEAAAQNQEVSAYNLAEATTPGYRQRGVKFETFDLVLGRATDAAGDLTGTRAVATYHDFRPGPLQQTGQVLDVALGDGDQFFTVGGPNGPMYTRSGVFHLDNQGRIVSQGGYPVQGEGGPIVVPAGSAQVTIASDGNVSADGVPIGRLNLVRFTDPKQLTAVGPTLYSASPQAGLQQATGRLLQGYREGANVQPADAMVRMITTARYYDAVQRALRTISDSIQLNTKPQA